MSFDYPGRLDRVRASMLDRSIEVLLLSAGADLLYFTGYEAMPLERLTMGVIPVDGDPVLVVPRLEAPRVVGRPEFSIEAWEETDNPLDLVAGLVGSRARLAVSDQTWAASLLGLQERLPAAQFVPAAPVTGSLRLLKDSDEVELLRRAGEAADRVVARLSAMRLSGRSERDLATEIGALTVAEGHDSAGFSIVASGPNAASPHHEPADRVIGPGDGIVIDFGGRLGGYHSDTTRTFHVGEPPPDFADAYQVLRRAQAAAVDAVAPGTPAEEVDRAARTVIAGAGLGDYFVHRTGHGIGLEVHENPYLVEGNDLPLTPGMAFSIEPGIYLPGKWGMRIEDIVVVGRDGLDRLNRSDRDIAVVE